MTLTGTSDPVSSGAGGFTPAIATARMADGTMLRTLHWPPGDAPWATALIVHGLGEHGGRYGTVAAALTGAGLDVHAYDHRGFGGSAGRRAYVERWSRLHDDLEERVTALRAVFPGRPLLIYGHSIGGLVTTGYLLADPARPLPDLAVLSSPALGDALPGWKHALASVLSGIVPKMTLANGLPEHGLSHDPAIQAAIDADALCIDRSTVRFGAEASAEQARVQAVIGRIDRMPVPTYALHGADDPIVPVAATEPLGTKGNVTRRVYPGLRHECHHEPEHAAVLAEVVAWLTERRAEIAGSGAPAPVVGAVSAGV